MQNYNDRGLINIGVGNDVSIAELAGIIKDITGFTGKIVWDASKPDGTPQKLLDVSKLNGLGWKPKIDFMDGVKRVYQQAFLQPNAVQQRS